MHVFMRICACVHICVEAKSWYWLSFAIALYFLKKFFIFYFIIIWRHPAHVEVRGQLHGVGSLLFHIYVDSEGWIQVMTGSSCGASASSAELSHCYFYFCIWGAQIWLGWPANKLQWSSCLYIPSAIIIAPGCFTWVLGIWTQFSLLA